MAILNDIFKTQTKEIIKLFYLAFIKKKYFPNTYIVKYILGIETDVGKLLKECLQNCFHDLTMYILPPNNSADESYLPQEGVCWEEKKQG